MSRGLYVPDYGELQEIGQQAREVPAGDIAPSQPNAVGPELGTYVRLPGANFAPAGAIPIDVIGDASIAPGASAIVVTIPTSDTLRQRVAGIGFHADDDVALGYLTWALLMGPDPVFNYSQVLAAVGSIRQLAEIFALVGSSQTLNVRATMAATAPVTYRVACRVRGWFYSEKEPG